MWLDHKFETKKEKEKSLGLSIEGLGGFFFFPQISIVARIAINHKKI
jgi:hypothetical protein